jgi:hypothetical protein
MPIYDPSGRPFTPGQLVGAKKLADYPSLNEAEFKEVCRQIEEGLSAGVPEHVPVTIPTGILARILQTVLTGYRAGEGISEETKASTVAPPEQSDEYLTPMPDLSHLRARVVEEDQQQSKKENAE